MVSEQEEEEEEVLVVTRVHVVTRAHVVPVVISVWDLSSAGAQSHQSPA